MLLDSDVLFFAEPTALVNAIENTGYQKNLFNADVNSSYTVNAESAKRITGVELAPLINSGLALIQRPSMRWDWIEEFLQLPGILEGHFWRIEQTVYALCNSRFGVRVSRTRTRCGLKKACTNLLAGTMSGGFGTGCTVKEFAN